MTEDRVTITAPRSAWETILEFDPAKDETYTPRGIEIFNAFQTIHLALEGEPSHE